MSLGVDLSVILGATIGAMARSGQSAGEIREQVDAALAMLEVVSPSGFPLNQEGEG